VSPNAIQFTFIRGQPDFIESLERDAALPVLFGWSLILLQGQIVFLELIIDPACWIVFEAERESRPRAPAATLGWRATVRSPRGGFQFSGRHGRARAERGCRGRNVARHDQGREGGGFSLAQRRPVRAPMPWFRTGARTGLLRLALLALDGSSAASGDGDVRLLLTSAG
jgi:hypothetical protein